MARAMWKGRIVVGGLDVPVKLYAAVEDRSIHFRLLDSRRKEPVKQHMVNPETGKVVEGQKIEKAMELDSGDLVILEEEELAELVPKESRDIEISRFLKAGTISHEWYDRPYYLGPDDNEERYFALVEALKKTGREGVARWVMRKKEYAGALRVEGDYLTLNTLRHAGEVVPASSLEPPTGRELNKRELDMARQLISAMEDEVDLSQFRDEYRDRVMDLIGAKQAGKVIKFPKAPRKKAEQDLSDMLKQSLAAVQKEKRSA